MLKLFKPKDYTEPIKEMAAEVPPVNKFQQFAARSGNITGRVMGGYIPEARLYFPEKRIKL